MEIKANDYSEDTLVEQPAIALFGKLGRQIADCFREIFATGGREVPSVRPYYIGRETPTEVVLVPCLRASLEKLNPEFTE